MTETDHNPEMHHPLETEEFVWARFRKYFPFGEVSLRERRYLDAQRTIPHGTSGLKYLNDEVML